MGITYNGRSAQRRAQLASKADISIHTNIATHILVHTAGGRVILKPLGPFLVITCELGVVSKCDCSKIDFLFCLITRD